MSILPFPGSGRAAAAKGTGNGTRSVPATKQTVEERRFARIRAAVAVDEDPLESLLRDDPELEGALDAHDERAWRRSWRQLYDWLRQEEPGEYEGPPLPALPSAAPPGSHEKLRVMEERYPGHAALHPEEYALAFMLPEEVETRVEKLANGVKSLGTAQRRGAA